MKVIAEGVETDEQLAFLQDNQCDEIQGYHFSQPVEPTAIAKMLNDEQLPNWLGKFGEARRG